MNSSRCPDDLHQALEQLSCGDSPPAELFERVARWRRACGDAEAAATWQTWSLLPPEPAELRPALASLWRRLGDTERAAALVAVSAGDRHDPSWEQLALLLHQQQWTQAAALQQHLLLHPPGLEIGELMELLHQWQQAERHQQALELLQPLLAWMERRHEQPPAQLCNAMADLLEKQQRFEEAEPWWQRSHALQPHQAWPLMRLGHQALRSGRPGVAHHYACQVLARDGQHAFAPRLQRKALAALGAERSLALLDASPLPEPTAVPLENPPPPPFWEGCRVLALVGFSDAFVLEGWRDHLAALNPARQPNDLFQLWLIASPDPLWLDRQARTLLSALPVLVTSWPQWERDRHGAVDRVLENSESAPFWRVQEPQA